MKRFWIWLWNIHEHEFEDTACEVMYGKFETTLFYKCKKPRCNLLDVKDFKTAAGRKLDADLEALKKRFESVEK
jgi:hypothetical protein